MKTLLTLSLATILIACGPTELTLHEKLAMSTERLVNEKNKATFLLKQAREEYWPDNPKLEDTLKINKETVECAKKTVLPDDFYKEMNRTDRIAPDSHFMKEMTKAFNAEADCYEKHNKQMKALLNIK